MLLGFYGTGASSPSSHDLLYAGKRAPEISGAASTFYITYFPPIVRKVGSRKGDENTTNAKRNVAVRREDAVSLLRSQFISSFQP